MDFLKISCSLPDFFFTFSFFILYSEFLIDVFCKFYALDFSFFIQIYIYIYIYRERERERDCL